MAVLVGTKLGPYEIVGPLGAGGMGEVYRARDTRLERDVAVKVLPQHLASNPQLKQRFEREARTVSSLNHPHICTLYDIGHAEGTDYLVMEYLEGETLARRLEKGALPTDQILRYGIEVADALDKAHRRGVVHRDLKPGNIMLTPQSGAKVLDFGLAKSVNPLAPGPSFAVGAGASARPGQSPDRPGRGQVQGPAPTGGSGEGMTAAPTAAAPLTAEGAIVGTFQYMSPEQLEGREADARSDIFSFGAVLYEMTTAKKAFPGKSQYSVASAILERDPEPITALQPMTPPALERSVKICLSKDPEERFQSAHDLRLQLQMISEAASGAAASATPAPARARAWVAWAGTLASLVVAAAAAVYFVLLASQQKPVIQASLLPPDKVNFLSSESAVLSVGLMAVPPVLSPDGTRLVFVAQDSKSGVVRSTLYVRPVSSLAAQPLAGTEAGTFPFWSPDSRFVGFFAGGKLKKIDVNGGPAQVLADAPNPCGASWSKQGIIVFSRSPNEPLMGVSAAGGTAEPLSKLNPARLAAQLSPSFLPDGKHFLFYERSFVGLGNNGIFVGSLDSLDQKLVLRNESAGYYAPPGYLLFVRGQTLMAQPFSLRKLETTGDAVPVAENVEVTERFFCPLFSTSDNGLLVYQSNVGGRLMPLVWFDRAGKQLGSVGEPDRYGWPALSPEGTRLAMQISGSGGNSDIWVSDLVRGTRTRLTFDRTHESRPFWTPDGKKIIFCSERKGATHIYAKAADGSGGEEVVLETPGVNETPFSISHDGRYLAYMRFDPGSKTLTDLWVLPLFGERKPFPIVQTEFYDVEPVVSPDGKWLAFINNESGPMQVYLTPFPGGGPRWQVSASAGYAPRWRPDGKELFFLSVDRRLMAVDVNGKGSSIKWGTPHTLFQTAAVSGPQGPYTVGANGQKFLFNTLSPQQGSEPLTLVVNWAAGLKK